MFFPPAWWRWCLFWMLVLDISAAHPPSPGKSVSFFRVSFRTVARLTLPSKTKRCPRDCWQLDQNDFWFPKQSKTKQSRPSFKQTQHGVCRSSFSVLTLQARTGRLREWEAMRLMSMTCPSGSTVYCPHVFRHRFYVCMYVCTNTYIHIQACTCLNSAKKHHAKYRSYHISIYIHYYYHYYHYYYYYHCHYYSYKFEAIISKVSDTFFGVLVCFCKVSMLNKLLLQWSTLANTHWRHQTPEKTMIHPA